MLFVMATNLFGVWQSVTSVTKAKLASHLEFWHTLDSAFCNCTSLDSCSPQGTFLEGLQTVVLMSNYVHTKVNISLQFNSRQQICRVQMLLGVDKHSRKSQQPVNWKSNRIVRTRRTLTNHLAKNIVFRKQSLALDLCLQSPIPTQLSRSCNEWLH